MGVLGWLGCACSCCFLGFGLVRVHMYMICVLRDTLYFFYTILHYLPKKKNLQHQFSSALPCYNIFKVV